MIKRRRLPAKPSLWLGMLLLALIAAAALFAPWLTPYAGEGRGMPHMANKLVSPSAAHPLGADEMGRDMLARTLFGARTSLALVAIVICSSILVGGIIGLAAGSLGGWTDVVAMRLVEVFLAFPSLLLAILVVTALGDGHASVALALTILWWPVYALMVRNQVAVLRIRPFVEAAQATGAPPLRIMVYHLLPNAIGPVLTQAAVDASAILLVAASLSFVGLGPEPPTADWGNMINTGRQFLLSGHWWVSAVPGAAIMITALAFALLVDALRSGT